MLLVCSPPQRPQLVVEMLWIGVLAAVCLSDQFPDPAGILAAFGLYLVVHRAARRMGLVPLVVLLFCLKFVAAIATEAVVNYRAQTGEAFVSCVVRSRRLGESEKACGAPREKARLVQIAQPPPFPTVLCFELLVLRNFYREPQQSVKAHLKRFAFSLALAACCLLARTSTGTSLPQEVLSRDDLQRLGVLSACSILPAKNRWHFSHMLSTSTAIAFSHFLLSSSSF